MNIKQVVIIVAVIIAGSIFICSKYVPVSSNNNQVPMAESASKQSFCRTNSASSGKVCVDIKGAVKRPGVYHLKKGSRVEEAIAAAGGSRDDADLKQVNLAKELMDQQILQIPKFGEQPAFAQSGVSATGDNGVGSDQDKVNINTASKEDLTKIDGVGDKKADKILEYRNQHGGFKSAEDLKNISGFGDKTVEKMKDRVAV